ncbi:glycosyltransferase [Terasakiella pusilla]|uniref:glycosyltransferase n=1 Tax=Terasakiella pusilla TaxID=64973 RepID=UPI003AA8DFA9
MKILRRIIRRIIHFLNGREIRRILSEIKIVPFQGEKRSIVFLNSNYYHFTYMAEALRRRGWNALTVSIHSQSTTGLKLTTTEDVNLYDENWIQQARLALQFFKNEMPKYHMFVFYGTWCSSFFHLLTKRDGIPLDTAALKEAGHLIGYSYSGCLDGVRQSVFHHISKGMCEKCVWKDNEQVCSDAVNSAWKNTLEGMCDLISTNGDFVSEDRLGDQYYYDPLLMSLDSEVWSPSIEVPERLLIEKGADEIVVMTAFANQKQRSLGNKDVKGSFFIRDAIERLIAKGYKIKPIYLNDIPQMDMPYVQVQADIYIDQLNYGVFGASAHQALMLGLPLITNFHVKFAENKAHMHFCAEDVPVVHATEETVFAQLESLINDEARRNELGRQAREFAMKWYDSDVCAERFEKIYDLMITGKKVSELRDIV